MSDVRGIQSLSNIDLMTVLIPLNIRKIAAAMARSENIKIGMNQKCS